MDHAQVSACTGEWWDFVTETESSEERTRLNKDLCSNLRDPGDRSLSSQVSAYQLSPPPESLP